MSETNNERYVIVNQDFEVEELGNFPDVATVKPILYYEFANALSAAKTYASVALGEYRNQDLEDFGTATVDYSGSQVWIEMDNGDAVEQWSVELVKIVG